MAAQVGTGVMRLGRPRLASAIVGRFVLLLAFSLLTGRWPAEAQTAGNSGGNARSSGEKIDPMSINAACYVCHMAFVHEEISKVHFKAKVTCIECHGRSMGHANDENIGATKPDITYERRQVDAVCGKCHQNHNVPAVEVVRRFAERQLTNPVAVCTDCHGTHRIENRAMGAATQRWEASPAGLSVLLQAAM